MAVKKPTIEEIKTIKDRCRMLYDSTFLAFDEDEKYYELDFLDKLSLPSEFKNEGIVLPTARDMVDTFVDHIDIGNARVFVNRKGTFKRSVDEAEMLRKFYLGLIHRTNVEADISPWRVAAKHYALHGLGVLKTVWDADRWPDKPIQKEGESENAYAQRLDTWRHETHQSIPIVIQAIHPRNIMGDPSYHGKSFVVELHEKMVFDVSRRWPRWSNPGAKAADDTVEFVSYWDDTYRADFIDDEPLLPGQVVKHNYGFLPYVFIDSGLGNMAPDGDLKRRYVGLLRYMFDMLKSESRGYSMSDIILKKAAWPWMLAPGEWSASLQKLDQRFGSISFLPEGMKAEDLREMTPQVPPRELRDHYLMTSDVISSHAAPRTLRGLGETGVRSGVDRRLMLAEAGMRYQYAAEAFKNGTAKTLINCARLLKNVIPGDVRVWARTPTDEFDVEVKKDLFREPFTCYVEFAPISEEDEYRRHDDLERLVSQGVVTRRWARTQMSNVDPVAMELDEEREMLRADPAIQGIISQLVQKRLAMALGVAPALPTEGASPQPGGAPGGIPGGVIPQTQSEAGPGSAGAIQQALAKVRSQISMSATQGRGGGGAPRRT